MLASLRHGESSVSYFLTQGQFTPIPTETKHVTSMQAKFAPSSLPKQGTVLNGTKLRRQRWAY